MRTNTRFCRNFLSSAALVIALSSPVLALARDPAGDRAAAVSDPEYQAGYAHGAANTPLQTSRTAPEGGAARAAAASDPENAAAYDVPGVTTRDQRLAATNPNARSAMASDPENVASHTEG